MIYESLIFLLCLSNVANLIYFLWKIRHLKEDHAQKLLESEKKPALTKDASELLKDMLNGGAIAVVKVIDPSSIFLWSPKDRGEE